MAGKSTTSLTTRASAIADDYWQLSVRPLHVLVFLLPLIVLYELGVATYLSGGPHGEDIRAKLLLSVFFNTFGVAGLYVPAAAVAVVLLFWHALSRDKWRVRPLVIGGMALESGLWALPLVVFGAALLSVSSDYLPAAAEVAGGAVRSAAEAGVNPWQRRATIALGAGIYEEFLFRLVGITLLHMVIKDLLGAGEWPARIIAVVLTALAFAFYHDATVQAGVINWPILVVYTFAGLFFGALFIGRGFGVVVGAHLVYNLIAMQVIPLHR